jgi:hypothetical protein
MPKLSGPKLRILKRKQVAPEKTARSSQRADQRWQWRPGPSFPLSTWAKISPNQCRSSIKIGRSRVYRYPADRLFLHTSFKLRQGAGHAPTRHHVPYNTGHCLPVEVGSGAATCPVAPDLASLIRSASTSPRVSWFRTPSPYKGGSDASCVLQLWILPPCREGLRSTTSPTTPDLASQPRWSLWLPHVQWLRILPPW